MPFPTPSHGWTCFHCGETFTAPDQARDHFGATPDHVPGCIIHAGPEIGLLSELRAAEARLARLVEALREGADALDLAIRVIRLAPRVGAEASGALRFMELLWETASERGPAGALLDDPDPAPA